MGICLSHHAVAWRCRVAGEHHLVGVFVLWELPRNNNEKRGFEISIPKKYMTDDNSGLKVRNDLVLEKMTIRQGIVLLSLTAAAVKKSD